MQNNIGVDRSPTNKCGAIGEQREVMPRRTCKKRCTRGNCGSPQQIRGELQSATVPNFGTRSLRETQGTFPSLSAGQRPLTTGHLGSLGLSEKWRQRK